MIRFLLLLLLLPGAEIFANNTDEVESFTQTTLGARFNMAVTSQTTLRKSLSASRGPTNKAAMPHPPSPKDGKKHPSLLKGSSVTSAKVRMVLEGGMTSATNSTHNQQRSSTQRHLPITTKTQPIAETSLKRLIKKAPTPPSKIKSVMKSTVKNPSARYQSPPHLHHKNVTTKPETGHFQYLNITTGLTELSTSTKSHRAVTTPLRNALKLGQKVMPPAADKVKHFPLGTQAVKQLNRQLKEKANSTSALVDAVVYNNSSSFSSKLHHIAKSSLNSSSANGKETIYDLNSLNTPENMTLVPQIDRHHGISRPGLFRGVNVPGAERSRIIQEFKSKVNVRIPDRNVIYNYTKSNWRDTVSTELFGLTQDERVPFQPELTTQVGLNETTQMDTQNERTSVKQTHPDVHSHGHAEAVTQVHSRVRTTVRTGAKMQSNIEQQDHTWSGLTTDRQIQPTGTHFHRHRHQELRSHKEVKNNTISQHKVTSPGRRGGLEPHSHHPKHLHNYTQPLPHEHNEHQVVQQIQTTQIPVAQIHLGMQELSESTTQTQPNHPNQTHPQTKPTPNIRKHTTIQKDVSLSTDVLSALTQSSIVQKNHTKPEVTTQSLSEPFTTTQRKRSTQSLLNQTTHSQPEQTIQTQQMVTTLYESFITYNQTELHKLNRLEKDRQSTAYTKINTKPLTPFTKYHTNQTMVYSIATDTQLDLTTQPELSTNTKPQLTTHQPEVATYTHSHQTQPEVTTHTEPETTTNKQLQVITQSQPELITQAQPELTMQTQPEKPTKSQPELITQTQPELITQTHRELTTQTHRELTTQTQPVLITRLQPELATHTQPELTTQTQPELITQTQNELSRNVWPVLSTQVQPDLVRKNRLRQFTQTHPPLITGTQPMPTTQSQRDLITLIHFSETQPEAFTDSQSKLNETRPTPQSKTDLPTQTEPMTESETELPTYPKTITMSKMATITQTDPITKSKTELPTQTEPITESRPGSPTQTEPITESRPGSLTQTEPITESRPGSPTQTDLITESRPGSLTQTEPITESRPGSPTQTEPITESRPGSLTQTEPITESRPGSPTQTELITESRPGSLTQTDLITESRPGSPTQTEPITKGKTELPTQTETITESRPGSPTQTEPITESRPGSLTQTDLITESRPGSLTQTEPITESRPGSLTQTEPITESRPGSLTQTEPITESRPGSLTQTDLITESRPGSPTQTETITESRPGSLTQTEPITESRPGSLTQTEPITESRPGSPTQTEPITESRPGSPTQTESITKSRPGSPTATEPITEGKTGSPTQTEPITENKPGSPTQTEPITKGKTGSPTQTEPITGSRPGSPTQTEPITETRPGSPTQTEPITKGKTGSPTQTEPITETRPGSPTQTELITKGKTGSPTQTEPITGSRPGSPTQTEPITESRPGSLTQTESITKSKTGSFTQTEPAIESKTKPTTKTESTTQREPTTNEETESSTQTEPFISNNTESLTETSNLSHGRDETEPTSGSTTESTTQTEPVTPYHHESSTYRTYRGHIQETQTQPDLGTQTYHLQATMARPELTSKEEPDMQKPNSKATILPDTPSRSDSHFTSHMTTGDKTKVSSPSWTSGHRSHSQNGIWDSGTTRAWDTGAFYPTSRQIDSSNDLNTTAKNGEIEAPSSTKSLTSPQSNTFTPQTLGEMMSVQPGRDRLFIVDEQQPVFKVQTINVTHKMSVAPRAVCDQLDPCKALFLQELTSAYKSTPGFDKIEILNVTLAGTALEYKVLFSVRIGSPMSAEQELVLTNPALLSGSSASSENTFISRSRNASLADHADPCTDWFSCPRGFQCAPLRELSALCLSPCHSTFCHNNGICVHHKGQDPECQCPIGRDFWYMGQTCDYWMSHHRLAAIACAVVFCVIICAAAAVFILVRRFQTQILQQKVAQTQSSYRRFSRFDDVPTHFWCPSQTWLTTSASLNSLDNPAFSSSEEVFPLQALGSCVCGCQDGARNNTPTTPPQQPDRAPPRLETSCSSVNELMIDSGKASDVSVCSWPMEPIHWTPFPILHQLSLQSPFHARRPHSYFEGMELVNTERSWTA